MHETNVLECYFCGARAENVEAAIEADWVPSFYEPGEEFETCEPCCGDCGSKYLEVDEDGELVRVTD